MRFKLNAFFLATVFALGASAAGQTAIGAAAMPDAGPLPPMPPQFTVRIDKDDMAPVKGAPFCATITTEHTQVFADGNRIHTTDPSSWCRDSQGRTRRESTLELMGAAAQNPPMKLITITDPVAGFRYTLDPVNKIARKMPLGPPPGAPAEGQTAGAGQNVMFFSAGGGGGEIMTNQVFVRKGMQVADGPAPQSEDLGDQTINGIHATGTRVTTTIAAGKIGNDQPINVTSERWYSPELKATVMTKHSDPWAGELKTEFTSVNTAEPDASLFTVPSDYKVLDEKAGPMMIKLPPPQQP